MIHTNEKIKGISLVEILFSLTISLFLLAGVLQVFLNTKQAYRLGSAFDELQENVRFLSDYLAKIIRTSGYRSVTDSAMPELSTLYTVLAPYIQVVDNGGINGSDILSLRFQGSGDGAGNPDGSIRDCLEQPVDANTMVTNVLSINANNELECMSINPNAASVVSSAVLVSGVENMQVLFGEDIDGDEVPDRYVSPNFAGLNLNRVVSIQISFLTASSNEVYLTQDTNTYNLLGTLFKPSPDYRLRKQFSFTVQLRNVVTHASS